ncbi:MAG: phosphoserine phosphatase SerB [Pseudomonadota bacterium]
MIRFFAVLTAARAVPDSAAAEAMAHLTAFGAVPGEARRLAPWAIEVPVLAEGTPQITLSGPYDVNLVPAQGRVKKLLLADMDSTIIPVECIDELADFAGVKAQVSAITEAAMAGELDFEQAIDARVALLKGLPLDTLQRCFDERITLNPGARALVAGIKAAGGTTALVSGGFTYFTSRVAALAGFDSHVANTLEVEGEMLSGTVARPILGRAAKAERLHALCSDLGITPRDVLAIGDGANDLDMVRLAGLGVAFHAKPALAEHANARLDHSDLRAPLALMGLDLPI